jgi:hypothetical protein
MRGENHALPVLREITLEDMVFVVVPLVESERWVAFYYQLHELLDEAVQLLEVCCSNKAFCLTADITFPGSRFLT